MKHKFQRLKKLVRDNSFDNLVSIVMVLPSLVGFEITRKKISVPFWIIHLSLLIYVYGVGSLVFQAKHARVASDFIKSYVNVSILVLTANNSYWWLTHRDLLRNVIRKANEADKSTIQAGLFVDKHKQSLYMIKRILFIFYFINCTNEFTSYLPKRADLNENTFSMTPCVGFKHLTSFPQREICIALTSLQELTVVVVVLNFQTMMLLLIAHTSAMYHLLSDEIMTFDTLLTDPSNYDFVKERLGVIIKRHTLILDIVKDIRVLYSIPMGINFGSNAVCICFFFFLKPEEYLNFMPIAMYCFLVFFLYCFLGQRLTNAAEVFSRAVYSCGWEVMDIKEQRAIFIMILQSQKSVDLLAADLIPVNMRTFASTSQGIYKFVTVFKL
ncbi:odorant receptor 10a-like [Leguminivora glycinivorella]|uniref:odorant receptor 10a-like n=1 Tax=Leguminivora glycinivorella TaxID=1035111 RepID=UPI002010AC8D|nr:odorant receptor 10a-like [Leguminivora glycinivorella]